MTGLPFLWNHHDPGKCHARVHRPKGKPSPQFNRPFPESVAMSSHHLSSSDSLAHTGASLPRAQVSDLTAGNSLRLLDNLLALGQDQLDVAGVRHVRVDLQVSLVTVSSAGSKKVRIGSIPRTRP